MNILLADDHPMVREGMRLLLTRLSDDVEIIEAYDYLQAVDIACRRQDLDLIILDRAMPGMDSYNGLKTLRDHAQETPIVILSASEDPMHARESLECGANGYIPKTHSKEIMLNALQLVMSGGTYVPTSLLNNYSIAATLASSLSVSNTGSDLKIIGETLGLTYRQLEVLAALMHGKTNKHIARELDISEATVRTHVNAILKALSVNNRTEAAHVASRLGLSHELERHFYPS